MYNNYPDDMTQSDWDYLEGNEHYECARCGKDITDETAVEWCLELYCQECYEAIMDEINEKDIENYAKSNSCATVREQDGFDINYTAVKEVDNE